MATGVKPRDDDIQFTRTDLEAIEDAMKDKKFRELLVDYCQEVRDPANQALYQKEMTQLEKERGYDVTFINPKGGYVIKTSVAGDRKAFINICSNDNVSKPSCNVHVESGKKGMNWQIPYSLIPPREDYDNKRKRCVIYDVVFHPDTLRMAQQNKQFRDLVNNTAFDALKDTYKINLDNNNFKFPKSSYKGMVTPAVIRKEDPDFKPAEDEEPETFPPEFMEKLYPQKSYYESKTKINSKHMKEKKERDKPETVLTDRYTIPKYVIKQQKDVDLQDFTYHKNSKQYSAIPSVIVVEINLPLLSSTKDCNLDVHDKTLYMVSEKPAKYKLNLTLPYPVNDQNGTAKFDKSKRMLVVSLPVINKHTRDIVHSKVDSGVESEENSNSDEDKDNLVQELSSTTNLSYVQKIETVDVKDTFIDSSLSYTLPLYTYNVLDNTIAFTFHVKNTEPDSVKVKQEDSKVYIKFTSIGSSFVPIHYAAVIVFEESFKIQNAEAEAWDNNVILQLAIFDKLPEEFKIGLNEDTLIPKNIDLSIMNNAKTTESSEGDNSEEMSTPTIQVSNNGIETKIVVSTNAVIEDDDDDEEDDSPQLEREIVWTESSNSVSSAKSILRKSMTRSFSESSVGDVASSIDYISSDCIPEESSLKKTVRFNNVIARKFYRYNSSIEGQKKKNQRKKSKKRSSERRKSESEAEDEHISDLKLTKAKPKPATKQRRDSGLVDTSDADTDSKNSPDLNDVFEDNRKKSVLNIVDNVSQSKPALWQSKDTPTNNYENSSNNCDNNIRHNTDLYDPDRLNKGQYLEVKFKNDLIFDLDM